MAEPDRVMGMLVFTTDAISENLLGLLAVKPATAPTAFEENEPIGTVVSLNDDDTVSVELNENGQQWLFCGAWVKPL